MKEMQLQLNKKTVIPKAEADLVKHQNRSILKVSIDVHKKSGFGELTEYWTDLNSRNEAKTTRENVIYERNVNRICGDIIVTGINPFDVVENLRKYCRTSSDLELAGIWNKWENKSRKT